MSDWAWFCILILGIVAIIAAILALEQILEHKRIMAGIFDESEGEE